MKKSFLFFVSLLVTLGCEGPEGPTGPKGKDGNANVHSSVWQVTSTSSWTYNSSNFSYIVSISDDIITQDIVDNGVVLVYMQNNVYTDWTLLPVTHFVSPSSTYFRRFFAVSDVGNVNVYVQDSDLTQPVNPVTAYGTHYFKVVAIASLGKYSKEDFDWNNYKDVAKKLHLED